MRCFSKESRESGGTATTGTEETTMKGLETAISRVSIWMNAIGGVVLVFMMLLTAADVALRLFGRPITGTYELVALAGAMVVAFAIPQTTRDNAHIAVDFLVQGRSGRIRNFMFVFTKTMGVVLFLLIAWYLFQKANELYGKGDVTSTLGFPFYPAAYGLAFCCFIESLVLIAEILTKFHGEAKSE
jgi:TRAP-type C4-dicarboxylate transport system permease small subunit